MGFTNFPYGVTSFGVPLGGSSVPSIFSSPSVVSGAAYPRRYLFVDGTNGLDGNDGLSTSSAKKTIQAAVDVRLPGDCIVIARGAYDENVVITRYFAGVSSTPGALWLVGLGAPRAAASISPSSGVALTNHETDVTLINLGLSSDDAATSTIANDGRRFRAYDCKLEGAATSGAVLLLQVGSDANIHSPIWSRSDSSDCWFENCEFAWGFDGVRFVCSDFGAVTQVLFKDCRFHNLSNSSFEEAVGAGGSAAVLYRNVEIVRCYFDAMEDGTVPSFILLNDDNGNTGIVTQCAFPAATNSGKNLASTLLKWVSNYHTDGLSTGQPS